MVMVVVALVKSHDVKSNCVSLFIWKSTVCVLIIHLSNLHDDDGEDKMSRATEKMKATFTAYS